MSSHASKQSTDDGGSGRPEPLSQKEHDVLAAIAAGASRVAIAESLGVSEEEIGEHIGAVLDKLHRLNSSGAGRQPPVDGPTAE